MENHLNFSFKAPYYTLNELNSETTNIWIVCHGYGQLAEYFIKRFDVLPKDHYVLALQGLSRFYTDNTTGRVGASWMTKEDRLTDLENQQKYIDAVMDEVFLGKVDLTNYKINFLGFSQGVAMIGRLVAYLKIPFDNLVIWAGGFPTELTKDDFKFIKSDANLKVVLGKQDQYFKEADYLPEIKRMESAIGLKSELLLFEGKHELQREVLQSLTIKASQVRP